MHKINFSLLALFLFVGSIFGQSEFEMGSWRAHFPYHQTNFLALDYPVVYAAGYSAFFAYNLEDYTIERYNSMNSLSDVGISAFRWHSGKRVVIIGYQSGQIDIFNDGKVINVSDIYRAEIIGSKQIKNIKVSGDTAFIVTPFGVSVMDMNSYAILSTYRFGTSDSSIVVNDLAILSDSLYVATSNGIFTAPRQGLNLLDFGNWKPLLEIPDSAENWNFCEGWADTLWIGRTLESGMNDLLYKYKNGVNISVSLIDEGGKIRRLHKEDNYLNVITNTRLIWYKPNGELVYRTGYFGTRYSGASDMVAYNEWRYFVADPIYGINSKIKFQPDNKYITPNGPAYAASFHVNVTDDEVWVSGGSHGQPWNNYGIYRFKDNFWTNYNKYTNDSLDGITNISLSITNPRDFNHIVAGSYGHGVVEFLDGEVTKTWNTKNSALENVSGVGDGFNWVTGLTFDRRRNFWVAQFGANNPIAVKKENNEWQAFNFNNEITKKSTGEMITTSWGDIWCLLPGSGVVVFNPEKVLNNEANAHIVFPIKRSDGTFHNEATSIIIDNDETVWIGMKSGGVFVYYNPRGALQGSNMIASQLLIEVDDRAEYLLGAESITDIKVDGGNRKWITTNSGGVFLVNEGGNKQILNLTSQNSPLISNEVYSVDINRKSGEVFFATRLGTVSYVGSATEGQAELTELEIYPSPVRADFNGSLIIRGLMEDTTIKITDLEGKLVYETYSNGGIGIWNIRDFDGNRVSSGVYLIFCASADGSFTANGKVFIAGN